MATQTQHILLRRLGVVFVEPGPGVSEHLVRALAVELADLGYTFSHRLQDRLRAASVEAVTELREWMGDVLAEKVGGNKKHVPLFRKFPDGVPDDTFDLWVRKVACQFLQAEGQPCLFCRRVGTTHVLSCHHIVCDQCFDGSNYSACPACEQRVKKKSPFFQPTGKLRNSLPKERVKFTLLDICDSIDDAAKALFVRFADRTQALSPADREDLESLVTDYGPRVLGWLPDQIVLKENIASIFGTLFRTSDPDSVLPAAKAHLRTATDVLRLIAVYSGVDPSLQSQTVFKQFEALTGTERFWGKIAELFGAAPAAPAPTVVTVPLNIKRFKVAPLKRALRRALLALLESYDRDLLVEDMLRHRSYWVWLGQFLHPHEYAKRFPNVARAFAIVRKKAPDGTPAEPFQTFYGKLEAAVEAGDARAMVDLLRSRPGELARRFDHALRLAGDDADAASGVVEALTSSVESLSLPVLLTLRNLLPTRTVQAGVRIYWPKGGTAKGISAPDERPTLRADHVRPAVHAVEEELLRRFAQHPEFATAIVDEALIDVAAPFNERTASPSAIVLPRGSRIPVPDKKFARLFLHWCQPEGHSDSTDLDLSIGFYDAEWRYLDVCSYYQLKYANASNEAIATSAGDLRSAPFPDGASEFVDLDRALARAEGVRYAVMIVNAFAGLPFAQLERGFAGLMFRDDKFGKHFDPRTVELKFDLQGESGMFLPLVLDLEDDVMHWLDTYSKGNLAFNNPATSNAAIERICPEMIEYFGSGVRMSLFELALLHAASRSTQVVLRGESNRRFVRKDDESPMDFLRRLERREADEDDVEIVETDPCFAILYRGDIAVPDGSTVYAVFRDQVTSTIEAGDLIA